MHTFKIETENGAPKMLCRVCNKETFNPADIEHKYCRSCDTDHTALAEIIEKNENFRVVRHIIQLHLADMHEGVHYSVPDNYRKCLIALCRPTNRSEAK